MNRRQLGSRYEEIAAAYLIELGYCILHMNYKGLRGEIDIIAKEGDYLVFIEVKYRKNSSMGDPLESVNIHKQRKIYQTACYYMQAYHTEETSPCRFDVVSILGDKIQLIQNAF